MNHIKLEMLDYRNILITNYKKFSLSENEVMVLLLIDSLNKEKQTLITGDLLALKMSLKSNEIDEIIVSLMQKNYLSYSQEKDILVTSMKNTYEKIINFVEEEITNSSLIEKSKIEEDAMSRVLKMLEEEMKRSLTPLEIEYVATWFKDGVNENMITSALNECLLKSSKVSIKQIDRIIIKNLSHNDRVKEGATTVNTINKKDIQKTLDIASYDWVNDDE